ncbi:MAG: biotin transporter BioY, partial [Gemmatimonadales bacterium]
AVLIVGGLLGPSLGAASLLLYLAVGAAGAPVFTPSPILPPGLGRLLGPTGGYLLAYPLAAYAVGRVTGNPKGHGAQRWLRLTLGVLAGLVLIHLGGLAQLTLITGNAQQAARFGTLPFLLGDLGKVLLAVLILRPSVSSLRARL